ncbi:MAG: hypothetical protein QM675_05070, partial [Protaetiibacter sp.]
MPIRRAVAVIVAMVLVSSMLTFFEISAPTPAYAADPVVTPTSIALSVDKPIFAAGETPIVTATVDVDVSLSSSKIVIKNAVTGSTVKSCSSGTSCAVAVTYYSGDAKTFVATVGTLTSNEVTVSRAPWTITLTV